MINRYFNLNNSNDYKELIDFEHKVIPIIKKSKFKYNQDKKTIINYLRKIFNNQWRIR